jgi:hypothetical protein
MELISGLDHEPSVLIGRGQVHMRTPASFTFDMEAAAPTELVYVLEKLDDLRRNPYNPFAHFRLVGTDDRGTEWHCGWTSPVFLDVMNEYWTLTGRLRVLNALDCGAAGSSTSNVELVFLMPEHNPIGQAMSAFVLSGTPTGQRPIREHVLDVLDTKLHFSYDPTAGLLSVTASTSKSLSHPFCHGPLLSRAPSVTGPFCHGPLSVNPSEP